MARRVTGIDLGAYSVKLVRLECGKQAPKFEVINVVEEVIAPDESGELDLATRQREALKRLTQAKMVEAEAYISGLEASAAHMRHLEVPFGDNRKIEAILPGLLDAELPFDSDEMITPWHRLESRAPVLAETPASTGAQISIAFGKKLDIAKDLQVLQSAAIDPRILHLSSAAPYELVRELGFQPFDRSAEAAAELVRDHSEPLAAIIDFGHRTTNICIFDAHGIKLTRSFMRGGLMLTQTIAKTLGVSFLEAQETKHELLDLVPMESNDSKTRCVNELGLEHFNLLFAEILQTMLMLKTGGLGQLCAVSFIGGGALTKNFQAFFEPKFKEQHAAVIALEQFLPKEAQSPSTALALAYSLSGLQVHAKENRFNFRKDEFAWRGELDFLRTKSTPLILWGLVILCLFVILWFANSLVLDKENQAIENQLKTACAKILGQKNIAPKKCLTMMKEQISSNTDIGIPDFSATDVYLKLAEQMPASLNIIISELDVMEKKVRINADTGSFEDVDKVVAAVSKIPCFVNVEKGRAQQVGNSVKFNLSFDLDCNPAPPKVAPVAKAAAKTPADKATNINK